MVFRRYSLNEGLSQGTVDDMLQDHQGFLWFATQDGLNRFDGYQFKIFRHDADNPQSLSSNYITSLYESDNGTLWIGTTNGLHRFNRHNETFNQYVLGEGSRDNVGSRHIKDIHPGADGQLWIATYGGVFMLDPVTRQYRQFLHNPDISTSIADNKAFVFLTDNNNQLWIGTQRGLDRLNPDGQTFSHFKHQPQHHASLSGNNITDLMQDNQGDIWISTYDNGLNRLNPHTEHIVRYQHNENQPGSLSHNRVRSLMLDSEGQIWAGTQLGLNLFQPETGHFMGYFNDPSAPSSLSNGYIWAMLEDNQNNLWFATSNGINQLSKNSRFFGHQYKTAKAGQGLSHNQVRSIAKTKDNTVWVGVNNGLNRYNSQTNQYTYYQHDPADNGSIAPGMVMAVLVDSQQRVWAGTYDDGLNLLLPTGKFKHFTHNPSNPNSLSHNRVYSIKEDQQGNIWVGTLMGLNKLTVQTNHFEHFFHDPENNHSLSHNGIYSTLHSPSGDIWVATRNGGLNRYNADSRGFERFEHDPENPNSLSHNRIFSLYQNAPNQLWLGTANGLNLFNTNTGDFTRYSTKQGLLNNTIYAVTGDNQGNIWVSTNRGLSRLDLTRQQFKNFDAMQGLQSNEFNNGAYFKGYDGELFFGGINGFNRFYPERIRDNQQMPNVAITEFYLANQPPGLSPYNSQSPLQNVINETQHLTLDYQQSVFSFEFAALHYTHPENNRYAYILEGFDQRRTNTHAGHRRATYTNLPAGDYVFRVKAANSDGLWQTIDKQINITITPAPWQTRWAYAFYLLIIGSTVGAFAYLHYQKQKAVAKSENRLSLALWSSGNEFWDWDIKHHAMIRSNDSRDFHLPYGQGFSVLSLQNVVHPDDFNSLTTAFNAHVDDHSNYFEHSYRIRNEEGQWIWVLDRGQVVSRDDKGNPTRALGTVQNINNLKTIEAQLRELNDQLEMRVEQRTKELGDTVNDLAATIEQLTQTREQLVEAQKMAALGALVTGIAHEINTPVGICITSISTLDDISSGFFQRQTDNKLTRSAFEQFKQTCTETLTLVTNNLQRTAKLIQTFKTVSVKQSTDKRILCHLNPLFQSIVSCFASQLAVKNIVVSITGDNSIPSYAKSLDLVLSHLIDNSILHGFSQNSFEQIQLNKINIDITADDKRVYIRYQDNGVGLQKTTKAQVFEPFYTTCRSQGESGLGMHIVFNHVTQRLKGGIEIDDDCQQGFAVRIVLPRE